MNTTIKIDFTQQCYGITQKIYISGEYKGPLKYLVSNLKENKLVNFTYGNTNYNPFKVCHGIECVTGLSEYKFEKGEEYTIEAQFEESCIESICLNFLDPFSFCSQDSKDNSLNSSLNLKINLFILLFLLLMIFYH